MVNSGLENSFLKPTEQLRSLQLLEEISKDSKISQRKLSNSLGIALGMTNACLKKMVSKGFVKVKGMNHKRIAYYLTPNGFSEKARLTYHFLQHTISYYSRLKDQINIRLLSLSQSGCRRIVCYGAGETIEVLFIILNRANFDFSVLAIVDDDEEKHGKMLFGVQVRHPKIIEELKPDAVLVTSIRYQDEIMHKLSNNRELSGVSFFPLT